MGRKDYGNEQIVVHWDARRCIHTGICTRTLPEVFDVARRPWISVDGAGADAIAAAVARCPTGALRAERLDGVDHDEVPEVTTVVPMPDGPLYLSGRLRVTAPDGTVVAEEPRLALCRCGGTTNPPFCDNTHRTMGFRSGDAPPNEARLRAQSPADICTRQTFQTSGEQPAVDL